MQCSGGVIEGLVTSVNTFFAYFEVEGSTKVHMSVLLTQGLTQGLPLVGSRVKVRKGHRCGPIYVLCKSSILEGNFVTDCPHNSFLNLITTYKLGATDIFKVEEILKEIEKSFTSLDKDIKPDVLMSLFSNVTLLMLEKGNAVFGKEFCLNRIITRFYLTTVRSCKYVEIRSNKYANFPYWSFGAHPCERNTMLFGFLEIQPVYGFYMIKDSHYQIACVISTYNSRKTEIQVSQLQNSYVLIERYTVITEIFNDSRIPNIEYIVVDVNHIHLIYSTQGSNSIFGIKPNDVGYPHVISFVVQKKSTVSVGASNLPELLLEVFLRFRDARIVWCEIFLIIPSTYVSMYLHFNEGNLYLLHHNTALKEVTNPELTRVKNLKVFEVGDRGCYFEPVRIAAMPVPELLSVPQCKYYIEHLSNDLVSFRGVIRSKRFTDPLPSRTAKKSTVYGFGTPGPKVHQIVFYDVEDERVIFLDCYLNNWENTLMPLGLIPQMEVIVRNVSPQSKKYLKSTIFTTFEVISYRPPLIFSTVNLYKNDEEIWGSPTYLSLGRKIPYGALVWGRVMTVFMLKLTIVTRCAFCNQIIDNPVRCAACKETERILDFTAKFNTLDQYGQSSVVTKSLQVLRAFLKLKKTNFEEFINTFPPIGTYQYNFFDKGTPNFENITYYLENINEKKVFLDLKCRKLEDYPNTLQRPMWCCVDARRR